MTKCGLWFGFEMSDYLLTVQGNKHSLFYHPKMNYAKEYEVWEKFKKKGRLICPRAKVKKKKNTIPTSPPESLTSCCPYDKDCQEEGSKLFIYLIWNALIFLILLLR